MSALSDTPTSLPPMPTRRLGRTGLASPVIALGTWGYSGENTAGKVQTGWSGHDDELARQAMRRAFELGVTHWDTADVYGDGRAERLIGEVLTSGVPRDRIVLATKTGYDRGGHALAYEPSHMAHQLDLSLRQLRTDHVDIYYLHHCDFGPDDEQLDGAIRFLHDARAAGKVRWIGLSDWSDEAIMRVIDRVAPDVVQPYRNLTHDTLHASGLHAYCDRHDVGLAFFSPIRHGLLLGKYAAPTSFAHGDYRNEDRAFRDEHVLGRLLQNAGSLRARFGDRSAEPVLAALVAPLLRDSPTACALLGMRNPHQVEAAVAASTFVMDDDEVAWVRSLYAGIEG
ncbi:MAG: aldo/keto reductase [Deltaproteobacteria bacterium]|nr:aldo/keto reductase [Deltaproteobacteria bacterium]